MSESIERTSAQAAAATGDPEADSDIDGAPPTPGIDRDDASPSAAEAPRVWLVLGDKRGDNAQVRNLARAVGWLYLEKSIEVAPQWVKAKPPIRASLAHTDRTRSDPLAAPWPDLVITAGRRLASVALWIKQASGGRTRIVVVGKPRGRASDFDLIVVASHYVLPEAPNVARHAMPLNQLDREALAESKKAWVGRLLLLPRPLTALLVGGPTGGLRFDIEAAKRLLEQTRAVVEAQRGSLYVTTSRRTPPEIVEALRSGCTVNDQFYVYDPDTPPIDNPYPGLLALADDFVVTSDSLSMMVEAAQLGRPLRIHPLERDTGWLERALEALGLLRPIDPKRDPIPTGGVAARTVAALGWPMHSRDLTAIPQRLVNQGLAGWLGEPGITPRPYTDEGLESVAERIRALVEPGPGQPV